MAEPRNPVVLLPAEQLLRELLLECAQHFPGLDIWITGGWVRDRLLGIPSSDLDLALSNMTGRAFAEFLQGFSARPDIESKYRQKAAGLGIPDSRFTRFHIMEKNAGAAKNLETAGGKLFGLDIDLANLRREIYDGQSRNPQMEFGSPEEDAFRRDATVNSLFYHLGKQEVVDLTGRGFEDLNARIMRTPLDPRKTFMDDPLRVLRLIRIGSKLGFAIDPEAMHWMRHNEIRRALDTMIKRDRINIEVFKMMKDPDPGVAFQHLFEANLYTPVFLRLDSPLVQPLQAEFPVLGQVISAPWPTPWPRAYRLLNQLLKNDIGSNLSRIVQSQQNAENVWTMAAYAPVAGARRSMLKQAVQEATAAIRLPTRLSKLLEAALTNFDSIQAIVDTTAAKAHPPSRSTVGMALRSWGPTWSTQVTYVMLAQAVYEHEHEGSDDLSLLTGPVVEKYSAFADFVVDKGLWDAHSLRPCLDGNEILDLLGLRAGGRFLKNVLDSLVAWQFDHQHARVEDAKAWLREERERLGVPLGRGAGPEG
jgi:tRNA nucleotidyltransferase/poly(A) polymerase